jgi:Zn-dependent peptidase ImmA (M78 family)/transcriptional regulator with XRE-family HTH domain
MHLSSSERVGSEFVPERLTVIREARGFTKSILAKRAGVTQGAISQFEGGLVCPSEETIDRFCDLMNVPRNFFFFSPPPILELPDCHFRHQRSTNAGEKKRVVATGRLALDMFNYFEQWVQMPRVELAPVASDISRTQEGTERIADTVRLRWGLGFGPISNVTWLLESKGVAVLEIEGHSERLDAFSAWTPRRPVVFLATEKMSGSRRRFDAAHELGHLLLHRTASPGNREIESQADGFASAFLLPRQPFIAECPKFLLWPALIQMKKRWKVSLAAIVRRAFDLGIYSEATYRRAYVQLNQRGWRKNEPEEPSIERPALLGQAVNALTKRGENVEALLKNYPLTRFELKAILYSARAVS